MTRQILTLLSIGLIALLATLAAQEPAVIVVTCNGVPSPSRTCPSDAHMKAIWNGKVLVERNRPAQLWTSTGGQSTPPLQPWRTECNCLSLVNCCSMAGPLADWEGDTSPMGRMRSISITPGPTTLAAPGLKVYTTYTGIPCGPEFPMVGCLPAEMQGWLVQIEGGDKPYFDVTLVYEDAEGRRHTHTQERVPRAEPVHGRPSFTAVPFRTGRAKMPPWFPEGSTVIRTEVWYSADGQP